MTIVEAQPSILPSGTFKITRKPDPWVSYERVHWTNHLNQRLKKVTRRCAQSNSNRMDADDFTRHTDAQTEAAQHDSTKSLRDNLHDLNFTERELEVEIKEIIDANSKLIATGLTLEKALQATEPSENISVDNLNIRNRRRSEENVNDEVQHALIKELDIIAKSQNLLKRSISQVRDQIRRNRTAKENLELVVCNKLQAIPLDTAAGILKNQSTNKQFFPAVASLQDHVSCPAGRSQEAHDAILAAEYERMASEQLDQLCRNIVHDVAEDLQQQADKVTNCILRNVDVLEAAEVQLKSKYNEVLTEMKQQQENIDKLHIAIRAKDDPVKVVQTRLHLRRQRCGMDCCEDIPHIKLVSEIRGLADTMDGLLQNLQEAEERMAKLEKCQMELEQEICLKRDSIRVDKIQVLPKRSGQPSYIRRLGRVNAF